MDFKEKVIEDVKQYRAYLKTYETLSPNDAALGYKLAQRGHMLSARWSDIAFEIVKKENVDMFEGSKTDLSKWADKHVSLLNRMAEHSRQVWNMMEKYNKELLLIERKRK